MKLADLPPETLAQICSLLPMPFVGLLLLTGDSSLLPKLQNGGADSLICVVKWLHCGVSYIKDGSYISRKFRRISFSPCFQRLKRIRTLHLEFEHPHSATSIPNTPFLRSFGQNIAKFHLRAPGSLRLFVQFDFPLSIKIRVPEHPVYGIYGYDTLAKLSSIFLSENPDQKLDLWTPIASILPSVVSFHLYAPFKTEVTHELRQIGIEMISDFQRLLPPSVTDFGWNCHSGQYPSLLQTLPPNIETLTWGVRSWYTNDPFMAFDEGIQLPATLTSVSTPNWTCLSPLMTALLTTVRINLPFLARFSFLPPTLTDLTAKTFTTTEAEVSPEFLQSLPRGLRRLRLRGPRHLNLSLLPPTLMDLSLSSTFQFDAEELMVLPKTLTRLRILGLKNIHPQEMWNKFPTLPQILTLTLRSISRGEMCIITKYSQPPPTLTHLEFGIGRASVEIPKSFGALSHLHLLSSGIDEWTLLQLPSQISSFKCRNVQLHGLLTKDDTSLTHLSGRIIINSFSRWISQQRNIHGRDIFTTSVKIDKILALPPNLQTISRKLRLEAIKIDVMKYGLPQSFTPGLSDIYPELDFIPPSLESYWHLTFEIKPKWIPTLINCLNPNLETLFLPQQLPQPLADRLTLQYRDFRIETRFSTESLLNLPSNLTKLCFTPEFVCREPSIKLPLLPNMTELHLRSETMASLIGPTISSFFPMLQRIVIGTLFEQFQSWISLLPSLVTHFTVSSSGVENFKSEAFSSLPIGLKLLILRCKCKVRQLDLAKLPQSLTELELNSTTASRYPLDMLPPTLQRYNGVKVSTALDTAS